MIPTQPSMTHGAKMKTVYAITEWGGKSYWTKIGVGFTNRDGSINLRLNALPVNGNLQIRDYEPPEVERRPSGGAPSPLGHRDPGLVLDDAAEVLS